MLTVSLQETAANTQFVFINLYRVRVILWIGDWKVSIFNGLSSYCRYGGRPLDFKFIHQYSHTNADKTKCMVMSRDKNAGRSHNMKIDNRSSERVQEFKY